MRSPYHLWLYVGKRRRLFPKLRAEAVPGSGVGADRSCGPVWRSTSTAQVETLHGGSEGNQYSDLTSLWSDLLPQDWQNPAGRQRVGSPGNEASWGHRAGQIRTEVGRERIQKGTWRERHNSIHPDS